MEDIAGTTKIMKIKTEDTGHLRMVRKKRKKSGIDVPFLILTLGILIFGLVMLFSASYAYAYEYYGDSFHHIKRQLGFAGVGVAIMLFIAFTFDFHILKKFAPLVYLISIGLLAIALVLPADDKGTHRWINIGSIGFQPSEIGKFAIVVIFAYLISRNFEKMGSIKWGVVPFMLTLGVIAGLVLIAKHLSATVIIVLLAFIMMFIGGTKVRWMAAIIALAGSAIGAVAIVMDKIPYAMERINGWLDPFSEESIMDGTWQTVQSLYAIGSGGLMGVGLGNSRQKHLYVPEPQNDFVFSIVCEELGFLGAVLIMLLFVLLVWRGFVIAVKIQDKFASMAVIGLTLQVGLQAFLNIAVVTNTIPNTGISLPFFSYGGSSLMMLLTEMGIILSISRYAKT